MTGLVLVQILPEPRVHKDPKEFRVRKELKVVVIPSFMVPLIMTLLNLHRQLLVMLQQIMEILELA